MCEICGATFQRLESVFGNQAANDLLWNCTAFPFDNPHNTSAQVDEILRRHKESGVTPNLFIAEAEALMAKEG